MASFAVRVKTTTVIMVYKALPFSVTACPQPHFLLHTHHSHYSKM